jgi:hypothetical protein
MSIKFGTTGLAIKYAVNLILANYSSVDVATGHGLDGWGSIPDKGKRFVSVLQRPDWIWDPPGLLFNWHLDPVSKGVKRPWHKTKHRLHLLQKWRAAVLVIYFIIRLHGVVLN